MVLRDACWELFVAARDGGVDVFPFDEPQGASSLVARVNELVDTELDEGSLNSLRAAFEAGREAVEAKLPNPYWD